MADDGIAGTLTEHYDHPNSYSLSLAEWYRRAALHGDEVQHHYRHRLRKAVSDRGAFLQVAGELMAAYFLEAQLGVDLTYVRRGRTATPDFRACACGVRLTVEAKTLVGGVPLSVSKYSGSFPSPAPAVRRAISRARKRGQLDPLGTNLVLLIDCWRPGISHHHAVDALYGDPQFTCWMGPDGPVGPWRDVRERNVLCQFNKNTRVSAVGVLGWPGRPECAGYFLHNAYAARKIPESAFDPWPQFVPDEAKERMVWRNAREGW